MTQKLKAKRLNIKKSYNILGKELTEKNVVCSNCQSVMMSPDDIRDVTEKYISSRLEEGTPLRKEWQPCGLIRCKECGAVYAYCIFADADFPAPAILILPEERYDDMKSLLKEARRSGMSTKDIISTLNRLT